MRERAMRELCYPNQCDCPVRLEMWMFSLTVVHHSVPSGSASRSCLD